MGGGGKTTRRETGWMTRAEMSRVFDIAPTTFDKTVRSSIRDENRREDPRARNYYCRGAVENWFHRETYNADGEAVRDPKQRKVTAEAGLAELKLAQANGALIPRDVVHQFLAEVAQVVRQAGERVGIAFGADAQRVLIDALVEVERRGHEVDEGALTTLPADDDAPPAKRKPGRPRGSKTKAKGTTPTTKRKGGRA